MEKQNSTGQEVKKGFNLHGKKKLIIIGIAALVLFSFAVRGLGMRSVMGRGNHGWGHKTSLVMGNSFGNSTVAPMEFESLGVVFAESTANRRDGYGISYNALMREAVAKGADAIINVSITPTSGFINKTWSGSALAVRYLN